MKSIYVHKNIVVNSPRMLSFIRILINKKSEFLIIYRIIYNPSEFASVFFEANELEIEVEKFTFKVLIHKRAINELGMLRTDKFSDKFNFVSFQKLLTVFLFLPRSYFQPQISLLSYLVWISERSISTQIFNIFKLNSCLFVITKSIHRHREREHGRIFLCHRAYKPTCVCHLYNVLSLWQNQMKEDQTLNRMIYLHFHYRDTLRHQKI